MTFETAPFALLVQNKYHKGNVAWREKNTVHGPLTPTRSLLRSFHFLRSAHKGSESKFPLVNLYANGHSLRKREREGGGVNRTECKGRSLVHTDGF